MLECDETLEGNGENYIGCQTMTVSGKVCQEWDEKFPQKIKKKWIRRAKKGRQGLGRNNYCRNPKGKKDGIWCYTTDPATRWETPCQGGARTLEQLAAVLAPGLPIFRSRAT